MAEDLKCNSRDPHSYLTAERVSREDMLIQAISIAIGQKIRFTQKTNLQDNK